MEQHPIPQNISSYEFRLVGDMTLKQFLQLSGGIVIALIIFRLPLPVFVKYPGVAISVLIGIMMAFVPVNGRPFTTWLMAFIRAIYAPTQFTWRLSPASTSSSTAPPPPSPSSDIPPVPQITLPSKPPSDLIDPHRIARTASPAPLPPPSPAPDKSSASTSSSTTSTPAPSPSSPPSSPSPLPPSSPAPENAPPPPPTSSPRPTPQPSPPSSPSPLPPPKSPPPPTSSPASPTAQIAAPTRPNILAGLITGPNDSTIEGAIVEIIDTKTGIPARALRTNRLGQFQIATPLSPGNYRLQVEKEGFNFPPASVTATNSPISPIIIKGQPA